MRCSVSQCVAVCCSVLQCVSVYKQKQYTVPAYTKLQHTVDTLQHHTATDGSVMIRLADALLSRILYIYTHLLLSRTHDTTASANRRISHDRICALSVGKNCDHELCTRICHWHTSAIVMNSIYLPLSRTLCISVHTNLPLARVC